MAADNTLRDVLRRLSRAVPGIAVPVAALNVALAIGVTGRAGLASVVVFAVVVCAGLLAYLFRGAPLIRRITGSWGDGAARASGTVSPAAATERADLAMGDLVDFSEDLDLTVWIGATSAEDRVREVRLTHASGAVAHRTLSLIHPYAGSVREKAFSSPALAVPDSSVVATWQPLEFTGRGVVIFAPPVHGQALRWEVSYSVPDGLWEPLRSMGLDVFRYDVRKFPIGSMAITFLFPPAARAVSVHERGRRGSVGPVERDATGAWRVGWTADRPTVAAKYEWDIRVDWHSEVEPSPLSPAVRWNVR